MPRRQVKTPIRLLDAEPSAALPRSAFAPSQLDSSQILFSAQRLGMLVHTSIFFFSVFSFKSLICASDRSLLPCVHDQHIRQCQSYQPKRAVA